MKKILSISLLALLLLFTALMLTMWWLSHPAYFPSIPESWVLAFVNFFYDTSKVVVDVEFLVAFTLSAIVVTICAFTLFFLQHLFKYR